MDDVNNFRLQTEEEYDENKLSHSRRSFRPRFAEDGRHFITRIFGNHSVLFT